MLSYLMECVLSQKHPQQMSLEQARNVPGPEGDYLAASPIKGLMQSHSMRLARHQRMYPSAP
eukprot:6470733-Amphidinium_carterae.1